MSPLFGSLAIFCLITVETWRKKQFIFTTGPLNEEKSLICNFLPYYCQWLSQQPVIIQEQDRFNPPRQRSTFLAVGKKNARSAGPIFTCIYNFKVDILAENATISSFHFLFYSFLGYFAFNNPTLLQNCGSKKTEWGELYEFSVGK